MSGLLPRGRARVAVELDGTAWRVLPAEVVLRADLAVGLVLDRARLRTLRRELRRHEALARAARALRAGDLSRRRLDERLAGAGVSPVERASALGVLGRAGLVDDERLASGRAASLADRGYGDEWIRHDLHVRQKLSRELAQQALAGLEPEPERARRLAEARGGGPAAARFLARRGFGEEAVETALGGLIAEDP